MTTTAEDAKGFLDGLGDLLREKLRHELDDEALEAIYRFAVKDLERTAFAILQDEQATVTVVHDALLDLWERLRRSGLNGIESLSAYLRRSIRNKAISHIRQNISRRNREEKARENVHVEPPSSDNTPPEIIVQMIISKLDAKCQELFQMVYSDRLKYEIVSEALEVSVAVIKKRMEKCKGVARSAYERMMRDEQR